MTTCLTLGVTAAITLVPMAPAAQAATSTVVSLTFDNNVSNEYTLGYQQALQPHGVPATFYVNSGTAGQGGNFMSWAQISALAAAGNEIGGKSVNATNLTTDPNPTAQVCNDRQAIMSHGLNPTSFAYPGGASNVTVESIVKNCGYGNARKAGSLSPSGPTYAETVPPANYLALRAYAPGAGLGTLANLQSIVNGASTHGGGWIPIVFTKVCLQTDTTCLQSATAVGVNDLNAFLTWLQAAGQSGGAPAGTVIKTVGAAATSADTIAPVTTMSCNGAACASTTYIGTVTVALAATDTGTGVATTRYTTDGSDPTLSSPVYTGPFPITGSTTVKFRSWDNAGNVEATNTVPLQVQQSADSTPPTTTITCNGATCTSAPYTGQVTVTLSATDNAGGWGVDKTYYTTDGSTPTTASSVYTGPLTVKQSGTVKFFSTDLAGNAEQPQSQQLQVTPYKTVVSLTFDDQYANFYTYLRPLLLSHDMNATIYVITSDSTGPYPCCMSWSQLRTMQGDGNDIGGHGREHLNLTDPNTTYAQKVADVCGSRQDLIDNGISDPASFAYPFGTSDATAESIVQSCGYQTARRGGGLASTTTSPSAPWAETLPPGDPYAVRAIDVDAPAAKSLADLKSYVSAAADHGGGWVPITFHQVCDQAAADWSSCMSTWSPVQDTVLGSFMDWLQNAGQPGGAPAGAIVQTMRSATNAPDTTPPATTALCNGAPCQGTPYGGSLRASLSASDQGGVGVRKTYYTTDGSTPTASSQVYSEPLVLLTTTTLKFFSVDNAGNAEPVKTATLQVGSNPDPVIASAGDIACDPTSPAFNGGNGTNTDCRAKGTSNLLVGADAVLPLGDDQYNCGGYNAFMQSYDPTWGRFKPLTYPVPGDKEYETSGGTDCPATAGAGYYQYFGSQAGNPSAGYYSYNLGSWHVIALNTGQCGDIPSICAAGSAQDTWLKNDLAANASNNCTLAYYQNPRFASGASGGHAYSQQIWQDLYIGGADVVLNGDAHWYERFTPMDAAGNPDPSHGIREIIAGTGGAGLDTPTTPLATSVALNNTTHGVLKMTLHAGSYDWAFQHDSDGTFTDSGNATCHSAPVAPAVTLSSPADAAVLGTATPTISGAAGTAAGDSNQVTLRLYAGTGVSGSPVQTTVANVAGGAWSVVAASLADGTYTAQATQTSSSGTIGTSAPVSFTVDTTAPVVHITQPTNGATAKTAVPTVAGTADGSSQVSVRIYAGGSPTGSPVQSMTAAVSSGTWSVVAASLADGTYTAQATQADGAGNTGTSAPVTFTVDTTGPGVTVTAPVDGANLNTATPRVAGTGSAASGASGVRVSVYGGSTVGGTPVQTLTAAVAADGSWSDNLAALGDGTYTLQAAQTDSSGNIGTSAAVSFTVDTTAPVVNITQPTNGATVTSSVLTVSGTAGTASRDAATVTVKVYSGPSASGTPVNTVSAPISAGAWTTDVSGLANGTYTAQATQADGAGNTGTSAPVTFTMDRTGPAVTVTAPADGANLNTATPRVAGTGSAASGASGVRVSVYAGSTVGGTPVQTLTAAVAADGSWSDNLAALGDGTYTLQAAQTDSSGNVGTSAAVTFTLKTGAPAVTLTSPADGAVLGTATPTISGAAGTASGDSNQVTLRLYAGTGVSGNPVQTTVANVAGGAWSVVAASLADGTYTAQATQTDSSGNTGTSSAVSFTVDTTAPVVNITQPNDGAAVTSSVLTVSGTAGTASRDAASVTVKVYSGSSASGTPVNTVSAPISAGAWTTDVSGLANGTYTLQATQSDSTGNVGTSAPVTVALGSAFTVTGVSPTSVGQGAVGKTLTISGSGFTSGVTASFSGTGIVPTAVTVTSSTSLAVTVDVGASAATGARDVVVGKSGERAATCAGCLAVNAGPKVTTLVPSAVGQGAQQATVRLNGTGFVNGATVTFSGTGVTDTITATSATQVTLAVSVGSNAATGARDVTVVQPDGGRTTCVGCFTVNAGPTVTSASPASIARGKSATVTLTGTEFVKAATVAVSGTGVNVGKTTWLSKTSMTVVLNATNKAAAGLRSITVTNPDFGSGTLTNGLTVT